MSVSVRVSDEMHKKASKQAKKSKRTIQGQIEFMWKVAETALQNPDLPITMIEDLLSMDLNDTSDCTPFVFGED
jgi:hypothetical protein